MSNAIRNVDSSSFLSIRQAVWALGVDEFSVCRAIRVGTLRAVRRRSKLVIPAAELRRVLDGGAR